MLHLTFVFEDDDNDEDRDFKNLFAENAENDAISYVHVEFPLLVFLYYYVRIVIGQYNNYYTNPNSNVVGTLCKI